MLRGKQLWMLSSSSITVRNSSIDLIGRFRSVNATARGYENKVKKKIKKKIKEEESINREALVNKEKRRTRSIRDYDDVSSSISSSSHHVPVLLGEVLDVFSSLTIRSFVDCTLGAAGHSSAIIEGHPEIEHLIGMDVDPVALQMASDRLETRSDSNPELKISKVLKNFKYIKPVLLQLDQSGVDGILMDLGMSSMQVNNPARGFSVLQQGPLDMRMDPHATVTAEYILNCWPESEIGRILRDYGEESNWRSLQNSIARARLCGGLHSTGDLVHLIKTNTGGGAGRQGWIKTATRVFQSLRIAVNDELKTLEDSLYSCFECLAPGGRLAVISFHSLEDRIVKQSFLNILDTSRTGTATTTSHDIVDNETWTRQVIRGFNAAILTKRPITPCQNEEKLNPRSRSAKLRVIHKL